MHYVATFYARSVHIFTLLAQRFSVYLRVGDVRVSGRTVCTDARMDKRVNVLAR